MINVFGHIKSSTGMPVTYGKMCVCGSGDQLMVKIALWASEPMDMDEFLEGIAERRRKKSGRSR